MRASIQKWGNSLAVRIPKAFAELGKLEQNSELELTFENGRIVLEPVFAKQFSLENLLSEIRPEHLHPEVDSGASAGKEKW